jgi:hypothetical protein
MTKAGVTGIGPKDPVPTGYPFELSDKELVAVLRDMLTAIPGFEQYSKLLPELKLQLVLIGYQERSRRNADRFARRSLIVALIAIGVAVISLVVSIVLAFGN